MQYQQGRREIQKIDLHAFGDASDNGISKAIYTTVIQDSLTSQGLLTAKARLLKTGPDNSTT